MSSLIRLLYALFIAGSILACVALGTSALYQGPKYPDYPSYSNYGTPAYDQEQKTFDQKVKDYDKKNKLHQHNIASITLPIGIAIIFVGIFLFKRSDIIGEGITLGGAGVIVYAVIYSSMSGAKIVQLLSLAALVLGSIAITHNRFPVEKSRA